MFASINPFEAMQARKISVVIPTYNAAATIRRCIVSLLHQKRPPLEVLVVDGGSKDSTMMIATELDGVRTLRNHASHFPGSSRNLGAEKAEGDTVLFLDADCVADKKLTAFHASGYSETRRLDGVQGIIRSRSRSHMARTIESQFLTQYWIRNLNADGTIRYFSAAASNLSLNRSFFLEHRFSEDLSSCDDIELFIKLRRARGKILFEPRASVYHHHPSRLSHLFNQRKWYGQGFVELSTKYPDERFRKNSMFDTSRRYLKASNERLREIVYADHQALCDGCTLGTCRINNRKLPVKRKFDDQYLRQITCLGIAAGVLKKRTGVEFSWPDRSEKN